MSAIITVENLNKTFDTKDGSFEAIKGISLEIEAGDIYGIIGMSGAGKSTLVRCLNYLERPTDGCWWKMRILLPYQKRNFAGFEAPSE